MDTRNKMVKILISNFCSSFLAKNSLMKRKLSGITKETIYQALSAHFSIVCWGPMLFPQVPLKVTILNAGEVALTTFKGLFSSVLALMLLQITYLSAGKVALITLEWLLS